MASLAQNVGEDSQHVPWNNSNIEFERGRQNIMVNTKAVYVSLRP